MSKYLNIQNKVKFRQVSKNKQKAEINLSIEEVAYRLRHV